MKDLNKLLYLFIALLLVNCVQEDEFVENKTSVTTKSKLLSSYDALRYNKIIDDGLNLFCLATDASIFKKRRCWKKGATITVSAFTKFPSKISNLNLKHIKMFSNEVDQLSPVNFKWIENNSYNADIRITMVEDQGNWSAIGTDAKNKISKGYPTMNISLSKHQDHDAGFKELRLKTLHLFGHVLGAIHENQPVIAKNKLNHVDESHIKLYLDFLVKSIRIGGNKTSDLPYYKTIWPAINFSNEVLAQNFAASIQTKSSNYTTKNPIPRVRSIMKNHIPKLFYTNPNLLDKTEWPVTTKTKLTKDDKKMFTQLLFK